MMGGSTKKSKEKGEKASELGASPFNSETVRIKIEFQLRMQKKKPKDNATVIFVGGLRKTTEDDRVTNLK